MFSIEYDGAGGYNFRHINTDAKITNASGVAETNLFPDQNPAKISNFSAGMMVSLSNTTRSTGTFYDMPGTNLYTCAIQKVLNQTERKQAYNNLKTYLAARDASGPQLPALADQMSKYLRTAWAITEGESAPEGGGVIPDPNPDPTQRGLFQIDTSFTRERIPADTRAIYDAAMAVLARYDSDLYKNVLSGSPDSPGGKKIDIYSARNLRNNLHANALMLDATGYPLMLTRIINAWTVVWNKAETSWSPGYLATPAPGVQGHQAPQPLPNIRP